MHDMYPGAGGGEGDMGFVGPKAAGVVYRGMRELFDRLPSDGVVSANSVSGQDIQGRLDAMRSRGLDTPRLVALSTLAQLDSRRSAEAAELETFNEMAELMEEAPGA